MKLNALKWLSVVLVAALAACGKGEPTVDATPSPAPVETPAPAPAPEPEPEPAAPVATEAEAAPEASNVDIGKSVFGKTCSLCHATGVAGAPRVGDKEDWGPRIAQGKDVLYQHSIEGYNGDKGAMPARGGAPSLSDDEMKAAVDYLVSQSQ